MPLNSRGICLIACDNVLFFLCFRLFIAFIFVLFSVCLVRYVLFGFVRISLFRWSVRFSVRSLILSTSPFHRTWVCLILAVFSCEDHTNSFPSAVLIHSVYYHHKCRSISVIYGLMIDRHSKHPVTYRAQQAIIATIIRLP